MSAAEYPDPRHPAHKIRSRSVTRRRRVGSSRCWRSRRDCARPRRWPISC
jgi:hypothetical protein